VIKVLSQAAIWEVELDHHIPNSAFLMCTSSSFNHGEVGQR